MEYVARGNLFRLIHDPAESRYRCNAQRTCDGRQSRGIATPRRRATDDGQHATAVNATCDMLPATSARNVQPTSICLFRAPKGEACGHHTHAPRPHFLFWFSSFVCLFASADSSCVWLFSRRELVWAVTKRMLLSAAYGTAPCITDTRLPFLSLWVAIADAHANGGTAVHAVVHAVVHTAFRLD